MNENLKKAKAALKDKAATKLRYEDARKKLKNGWTSSRILELQRKEFGAAIGNSALSKMRQELKGRKEKRLKARAYRASAPPAKLKWANPPVPPAPQMKLASIVEQLHASVREEVIDQLIAVLQGMRAAGK